MSLNTNGFYTELCGGWEDAVGDSLKASFSRSLDLINSCAGSVNSYLSEARSCIDAADTILINAREPSIP